MSAPFAAFYGHQPAAAVAGTFAAGRRFRRPFHRGGRHPLIDATQQALYSCLNFQIVLWLSPWHVIRQSHTSRPKAPKRKQLPMPSFDPTRLIRYYQTVREQDFEEFFKNNIDALEWQVQRRLPRRMRERTAVVEDVCMVVMTKIWLSHRRAAWNPQRGNLHSWIGTLVRNECANYFRSADRCCRVRPEAESGERSTSDVILDNTVDHREATMRDALDKEASLQRIYAEIEKLPERKRVLFDLRFNQNLVYHQIADHVGSNTTEVHRAIAEIIKGVAQVLSAA